MNKDTKNSMILEMREAVFDGASFEAYFTNSQYYRKVDIKKARKIWERAERLTEDWEMWLTYMIQTSVLPAFEKLIESLDDYYNEGGYNIEQLSKFLRIDKDTIVNLLNRRIKG